MTIRSELPWVEKYRARSLNEIKDQRVAVRVVKGIIRHRLPMNIILAGTQGTGKTSVARIMADSVAGDHSSANVMEINASDRVRMDFIRNELKSFIDQMAMSGGMKIVIMEEADNIPPDAQNALRRIMESSYKSCRYVLTCNYLSNIIDPIRSRCMIIRFKPVSAGGIATIIDTIMKSEHLDIDENLVKLAKKLRDVTDGDMRLVINTLQACDLNNPIESFYKMLGFARPITVDSIMLFMNKGRLDKILDKLNVLDTVSHRHFLKQLQSRILNDKAVQDPNTISIVCELFAEYDERLTLAGNQENQLVGLLAKLCDVIGGGSS